MPDPTEFSQDIDSFELLPESEDITDIEDQLDAAEAGLLEDPLILPDDPDPPIPWGRTWKWDRDRNRFLRHGGAPSEVRDLDTLAEWLQNAWTTSAGVHPSLPEDFGLTDAGAWFGWADPTEALADLQNDMTEAALQHERVQDLDDMAVSWDPQVGTIYIDNLVVITDAEDVLPVLDATLTPEP